MDDSLDDKKARIRRALDDGAIKKTALVNAAGLTLEALPKEGEEWNPRRATVMALTAALDRIVARLAA